MQTGDIQNTTESLKSELRQIKYPSILGFQE